MYIKNYGNFFAFKELDADRSELTKLKKSVRALYNSTNSKILSHVCVLGTT